MVAPTAKLQLNNGLITHKPAMLAEKTMRQNDLHEPSDAKSLLLDNQLCFGLYAASHAMTKAYRARLKLMGLTYPQYLVMLALWEKDARTVSELGQSLCLDSGTLSPLLKRLETGGFIRKTRLPDDERQVEVALTPKAEALRQAALDVRKDIVRLIGMTETSILLMRADLNQLISSLALDNAADSGEMVA